MPNPKILFIDIETFPHRSYTWGGKYQVNVIDFVEQGCIATFSAKWLGDKKIISHALNEYAGYVSGSYDDKALVADLHKLLDEADVVVAHNGNSFDIKYCNARFICHGMTPPSPYKTVDTKLAVKKVARFASNSLDDLGETLGLGRKIHTDFSLWLGCINGDPKSWAKMVKYNEQDVVLLERLYTRLLPWVTDHPNVAIGKQHVCPKCGSQDIHWRGTYTTTTRTYSRFRCMTCGGWGRLLKSVDKAHVQNCA